MDILAHYPRDKRYSSQIKLVCYPVSCYRQNAGVAQNYLFVAYSRWVSIVSCLDVSAEEGPYFRKFLQKFSDNDLCSFLANVFGTFFDFTTDILEAFLHFIR